VSVRIALDPVVDVSSRVLAIPTPGAALLPGLIEEREVFELGSCVTLGEASGGHGVVGLFEGLDRWGEDVPVPTIGCLARVLDINYFEDAGLSATLVGLARVELVELVRREPRVEIRIRRLVANGDAPSYATVRDRALALLASRVGVDVDRATFELARELRGEAFVDAVAGLLSRSADDRRRLLEAIELEARVRWLDFLVTCSTA